MAKKHGVGGDVRREVLSTTNKRGRADYREFNGRYDNLDLDAIVYGDRGDAPVEGESQMMFEEFYGKPMNGK